MEPDLNIAPELISVLEQLQRREPIFHRPEFGTTREDFEAMTEPGFWEVGASGQRYSRAYVLDVLESRYGKPHDYDWRTEGFHCAEIAPDNYLLTYTLHQGERVTHLMAAARDGMEDSLSSGNSRRRLAHPLRVNAAACPA